MPQARKCLVSLEVTPFYHVVSRCVRRYRLCGVDPLTGKDYSARKQDIQNRLALLAEVFSIDVCAFAILSNHHHLVLHIDEQTALEWSDMEVAQRWTRLFTGPVQGRIRRRPRADSNPEAGRPEPYPEIPRTPVQHVVVHEVPQ